MSGPQAGDPHRSFYANEVVRLTDGGTGAVHRELEKLLSVGLLTVSRIGNQKHYRANPDAPIFEELLTIVRKTFGLADVLRRALESSRERIDTAFIFGSVAAGSDTAESDIDLFIVARDISYADAMLALSDAESSLRRKISPTLYRPEELKRKLGLGNSFLQRVLDQPKIFLIGSRRELLVEEPATPGEDRKPES